MLRRRISYQTSGLTKYVQVKIHQSDVIAMTQEELEDLIRQENCIFQHFFPAIASKLVRTKFQLKSVLPTYSHIFAIPVCAARMGMVFKPFGLVQSLAIIENWSNIGSRLSGSLTKD